jgi:hypothetical protein
VIRLSGLSWTRAFLARPVEHEPTTYFVCNDAASCMLSAPRRDPRSGFAQVVCRDGDRNGGTIWSGWRETTSFW